jgi:hypothetical protein
LLDVSAILRLCLDIQLIRLLFMVLALCVSVWSGLAMRSLRFKFVNEMTIVPVLSDVQVTIPTVLSSLVLLLIERDHLCM